MTTKSNKKSSKGVTSASEWKSSRTTGAELEVPSGNVCLVRQPDGMRMFMKRGMIPNALLPIVKAELNKAEKGDEAQLDPTELLEKVLEDPTMLQDMLDMMDAVVIDCVIQPVLHPVPDDDTEREDDLLYIDDVDFEDRSFIFSFAMGGTKDLERFRHRQDEMLGAVSAVQGVGRTTE